MFFRQIMDPELAQYAYLLGCQRTGEALIIDPGRDIDRYTRIAKGEGLSIVAATETHRHMHTQPPHAVPTLLSNLTTRPVQLHSPIVEYFFDVHVVEPMSCDYLH